MMGTIPNTLCGVFYSVLTEILKEDLLLSSFYIYIYESWKSKKLNTRPLTLYRVTELLGEAAGFELKQTPDCCKKWTETC